MKLNFKKLSRRITDYGKQKALPVFLSTTLAVNSMLAGMPIFNVVNAESSPQISGEYFALFNNGFDVGFHIENATDANLLTIGLYKDATLIVEASATQALFDDFLQDGNHDLSRKFYIPGPQANSTYWTFNNALSWSTDTEPTKAVINVASTGGSDEAIVANYTIGESSPSANYSSIIASLPQIASVDAYYSDKTDYTAISTDFKFDNITNAKSVELRVNRSDSSTYSIFAQPSVLSTINSGEANTISGPIVITGSRTSGSWTNQTGTWVGDALPVSVDVIITLNDDTEIVMRDDSIGSSLATQDQVLPVARNVNDNISFSTIQRAIEASTTDSGESVEVFANSSEGLISIDKDLTITGTKAPQAVISPTSNTKSNEGWITIQSGAEVTISNLNIDGSSMKIYYAILSSGADVVVDNVVFSNISFNDPRYGIAVASYGGEIGGGGGKGSHEPANLSVVNSTFENIQRVGVVVKGDESSAEILGNVYTGKGDGVHIDYLLDLNAGANAVVKNNTVSNNTGIYDEDAKSAAFIVGTYHGGGTTATFENNDLRDNFIGIGIGYDENDVASVIANYNNITNNDHGILNTSENNSLDARFNWWGNDSGPSGNGLGTGDSYESSIGEHSPWLCQPWQSGDRTSADGNGDCDEIPVVESLVVNSTTITKANHATTQPFIFGENQKIYINLVNPSIVKGGFLQLNKAVEVGNPKNSDRINYSLQQDGEGNWFAEVDTTDLDDGAYLYKVEVHGSSTPWGYFGNNSGWTSPNYHLIVDNNAPSISGITLNSTTVSDSDVRSENCTIPSKYHLVSGVIDLSATITDTAADVTNAAYKIRKVSNAGCTQTAIYQSNTAKMVNENGDNWITLQSSAIDTAADAELVDGNYTIQMTIKDAAGNQATRYVDITVDNTAPDAPSITKPTPRQWFKSKPIVNAWTAADDANGVDYYQVGYLYDDGHKFGGSSCEGEVIDGNELSGCRDEDGLTRNHQPGSHEQMGVTVWVRAVDNAGNVGPWSKSVHYYYDSTTPVTDINVSEVVDGIFTVSGHASDNLALNRVYVQLVSREDNSRYGGTTLNLIPEGDSADWSVTYNIADLGSPEGLYAAHVSVVDMAGNSSTAGWTENFMVEAVVVDPSLTADYFTVHSDSLGVGFSIDNFDDATSVLVEIFDAEDDLITQNTGDSDTMIALLNSHSGQISSPFYIPLQDDSDDYWLFGDADWANVAPSYAVVTVNYGSGDSKSDRIDFTSVNGDDSNITYDSLIASLPDDGEGDGGGGEPTSTPDSSTDQGQTLAEQIQDKVIKIIKNIQETIFGAFGLNSDDSTSQDENGEEENANEDEDENEAMAMTNEGGDVAGESAENNVTVVGNATDEGCARFLGLCWYYWIPIVGVVAGGAIYLNNRRLATATPTRRIR